MLHSFRLMGNNSRFALFTKIENDLALGHTAAAAGLLGAYSPDSLANTDSDVVTGAKMADDTAANQIVQNYRDFYRLYIKFEDSTLTTVDSAYIGTLAGLCPLVNGAVVYKARALYDIVYDTLRIFPNNCDSTGDSSAARVAHYGGDTIQATAITSIKDATGQKYVLFPNPNDGNFVLEQAVEDNEPVLIEVWDAIGRIIYQNKINFSAATHKLHVGNISGGFYLLQVKDSKNRVFRFKFIVQ